MRALLTGATAFARGVAMIVVWGCSFVASTFAVTAPNVRPAQAAPSATAGTKKSAAPDILRPRRTVKPFEGYYDDGFSLAPDGDRLAVVRTDGATFSKLEIIDLASGQAVDSFDLGESDDSVESIEILPGAAGILLTLRHPVSEQLSCALIDGKGRLVAKSGQASDFARTEWPDGKGGTEQIVVGMDKTGVARFGIGGEVTYTVSVFRLPGLVPVGKPRSFRVGPEGDIRGTDIKFISFQNGYGQIVGQRMGGYDKAKDFRQPSRLVVMDALTGKVSQESEITDVYAWAVASKLRGEHPNRTAFVQPNQEQSGFEVIDAHGKKQPLTLAVPFRVYDPRTLQQQEGPEKGSYTVAVAVDPVNPDAVARKKADVSVLDFYAVDVAHRRSRHRARILLPRPVGWQLGHGKLIVLKRFKRFPRGGDALDIYDLP